MSPKGRTELKIGRSRAKNCVEFHGNLRFSVAPQKPPQKCKNLFSYQKFLYYPSRKTKPRPIKLATIALPPYEINGNTIPVIGSNPTIPPKLNTV